MFRGIRLSALGVTLSALVALHGCGGGSDGDSTPSVNRASGGRWSRARRSRWRAPATCAAVATPRFGTTRGVTQSSNLGVVTVTVEESLSGMSPSPTSRPSSLHRHLPTRRLNRPIRAIYDDDDVVDTGHDNAEQGKNLFRVAGQEEGTRLVEKFKDGDLQGADFYRRLEDGDLTGVPEGDLWVHVQTDFDGTDTDEANYIAGGYWVFIPDDEEEGEPSFGVFVDGADPVAVVDELTGTAEYRGTATGVYSLGGGKRNREFDAKAALEADFGEAGAPGSIEGEIYEFDGRGLPDDLMLILGNVTLTNMSHFTGDTSMDFGDDMYTGTWGGQFYNATDTGTPAMDYPGAVAGTFGAVNDDEDSFIGIFGAYLEE